LPVAFDWPTNKGKPLDFLLQVNLSDIASLGEIALFPKSGLLSFFYDLEEQPWGYDPDNLGGYAVRFFPRPSDLRRFSPPRPKLALPGADLHFWFGQTLPDSESRAGNRFITDLRAAMGEEPDYDALDKLSHSLFRPSAPSPDKPRHQLGGHSQNIQGDMQLEAQLVMNGLYCGDSSGYHDPRAAKLEAACEDWSLLLQLDSDDEFMWGDGGMLYYWARTTDITRRDFSKAWMNVQCY
jgi:uncharacterized protein YwqG